MRTWIYSSASLAAILIGTVIAGGPVHARTADGSQPVPDDVTSPDSPTEASGDSASSTGIDAIIVTARKRAEDVQDVPLSVSAVSGDALERRGVANIKELAVSVPSLALIGQNNARSSIVQIRGIGSGGLNSGIEPDVGVYFDGTYQKSAAAVLQSNLLDIEAVEVLRGPQGTLYGRNTPVGAIIIRSRDPSKTPEAMIQAGAGNYQALYVQGYVGGPLSETVAGRLSFFSNGFDGYDYNTSTRSRVNGNRQYGGRVRLQWKPGSTLTADLIAFYTHTKNECCIADNVDPFGPLGIATPGFLAAAKAAIGRDYTNLTAKDHVVDSSDVPDERIQNFGISLTGELDLSDALALTSISAYTGTRINTERSSSLAQPIPALNTNFQNPIDSFSQEFRISSSDSRRINFQLGTYLFHESTDFSEDRTADRPNRVFPSGGPILAGERFDYNFKQKTFSASAYGQATWNVTDQARLTAGARYSYDRKRGSVSSVVSANASPNFRAAFANYTVPKLKYGESKLTWLLSGQYDITPDIMAYVSASTGWKSGGFNGRPAPANATLVFSPEDATNYEFGIKSTFWGRRGLLNVSFFKLDVEGFQDSVLNPVSGVGFIVGNAGDINAKGMELDFQIRPVPSLLLTASAAYLDSKFSNYSAGPCFSGAVPNGSRPNTCDYNGLRPAFSPRWRGYLGAEYTQPVTSNVNGFVRGDASYVGDQNVYSALDPRSVQQSYTLVNGRIGVEASDERWRISLFGKNLTDKAYYNAITPVGNSFLLSAGGTRGVSGPLFGWLGAPRTYGIEGSVKF